MIISYKTIVIVIFFISFAAAFVYLIQAVYHMCKVASGVKNDKRVNVGLLAPFSLFNKKYYTESGNLHRERMFNRLCYFSFSIVILLILFYLMENDLI